MKTATDIVNYIKDKALWKGHVCLAPIPENNLIVIHFIQQIWQLDFEIRYNQYLVWIPERVYEAVMKDLEIAYTLEQSYILENINIYKPVNQTNITHKLLASSR